MDEWMDARMYKKLDSWNNGSIYIPAVITMDKCWIVGKMASLRSPDIPSNG
ncbi:MAG: hypothetical protein IIB95_09185 [Candidatus Marinimicrobia bacterium]|nr:hypothetical protein [Candidatus Neomarinimicrobiota bacterium]